MDYCAIGKRIRLHRKKKGWTIEKFAELLDLSITHVGLIERGENAPSLEALINIANTLEVSADTLLADVLKVGYIVKANEISEVVSSLSSEDQNMIFEVMHLIASIKKTKK